MSAPEWRSKWLSIARGLSDKKMRFRGIPCLERLTAAELQCHDLLVAVGENGDHAEDCDAGDLPGATHPQGDRVEVSTTSGTRSLPARSPKLFREVKV